MGRGRSGTFDRQLLAKLRQVVDEEEAHNEGTSRAQLIKSPEALTDLLRVRVPTYKRKQRAPLIAMVRRGQRSKLQI
jgi:hypothetical protein